MKTPLVLLSAFLLGSTGLPAADFNLRDYAPPTDGATDATPALTRCFAAAAQAGGGTLVIPAGDYRMPGAVPVPLYSRLQVSAQGARFHLPETLGDKARVVLFAGTNITDFSWLGGEFLGHVFDPARPENRWEPNANTRMLVIGTTPGGTTSNLLFREVLAHDIAGAVINVTGALPPRGESEVTTFASDVTLADCTLLRSGKFMWDYGYLWQMVVWPEDYTPRELARALRYFRTDLIRDGVKLADGDDCVRFDNRTHLIKISTAAEPRQALCFYGDALPKNIVRGRQYYVVAAAPEHIQVAEQPGGKPIRFAGAGGPGVKIINNLFAAIPALFAPTGAGPGKGAFDLVGCRDIRVTGCTLSALGDTMHIQRSHDVVFAHNHITGSRMGAFFIAEYCQRFSATSNTVDGSNGSRVMSVEKSATDIAIVGNTFCNGGRGSWINQPRNLLMQGNVFSNNTTKCEHNPRRGRRSFVTGDYEKYAELYFTTYEPGGRYGNIVLRDNVFVTGSEATHAITFAPGGENILLTGNSFRGSVRSMPPAAGCTNVVFQSNPGLESLP